MSRVARYALAVLIVGAASGILAGEAIPDDATEWELAMAAGALLAAALCAWLARDTIEIFEEERR